MQAQGWGRIVNIAGAAGTGPTATNLPASFANVNILNMTRALSDVGVKDGILVNTICPGLTNTPRTREHRRVAAQRAGRVRRRGRDRSRNRPRRPRAPRRPHVRTGGGRQSHLLPRLGGLQLRPGQRHLHGRRRPPRHPLDPVRLKGAADKRRLTAGSILTIHRAHLRGATKADRESEARSFSALEVL